MLTVGLTGSDGIAELGGARLVPCQNSHNCSELVFSVPVRLLSGTR